MRRLRRGLEDIEDRVHGHAIGCIGDELAPLREVAPHRHQPLQRFGLEGPNEPRRPPPQRRSLGAARRLELGGDLQQVADDHLIVPRGFGLRMLINGLRDHRRLGGRGPAVVRRRGQRRPRQAHPQLGRARIPFPGRGTVLVRELQALVRERVELHVRPGRQAVSIAQTQGLPGPLRFDGERPERIGHFALLHAAPKRDGAQVVPMQPARELPQHGMLGIGSDTLDHELIAGHAERDRSSILQQQPGAPGYAGRRRSERRVSFGIHGVFMERDRELDQEIGEIAR